MAAVGSVAVIAGFYVASYRDATGAFFHYDDYWLMADAARVQLHSPLDLVKFFIPGRNGFVLYRPFSQVIYFRVLHALFGYDTAGYHAVQILFHCLNAVLVGAIARAVLRSSLLGLATALVYATAPGHAIAVFWVALFSMTGPAFVYLLALWLWLRLGHSIRVPVCLALFVIALFSGEHAVTLPLALTLTVIVLEGRWPRREDVMAQAPFYALAGAYVAAKLYYFRFMLPASFPNPIQQAIVREAYGWSADPRMLLDHLGRYAGFALDVLFPLIDPYAEQLSGRATLLGAVIAVAMLVAAIAARPGRTVSAPARAAAFGLLLFPVGLGPVLVLRSHLYGYYVGIAGMGLALATVAGLAALPRVGSRAVAAWIGVVLLLHAGVTWRTAREQSDFGFLREFSRSAARWLYTVERIAADHPDTRELLVSRNPLTLQLFDDTGAHRLLLPHVDIEVRTVEEVANVDISSGRRTMSAPYVFPPGQPWPGSQPRWDWLRCRPVL